ncbi:MAG: hypothetical protein IPM98_00300 [Lewinellaceae bacterium]|nr:hypothetical protein [Lewinellaceae bacterium]
MRKHFTPPKGCPVRMPRCTSADLPPILLLCAARGFTSFSTSLSERRTLYAAKHPEKVSYA